METRHWAEVLYNHIYVYIIFIMIIIITIKIVNKLWICVSITIAIFHCKIKSSIKKKYFTVQQPSFYFGREPQGALKTPLLFAKNSL